MAPSPQDKMPDPRMDRTALYREEIFTDRKVGTIRRLVPVTPEGATDAARKIIYSGEVQILTAAGALPLSFEIPADTLDQAVAKFGDIAKQSVDRAVQELQEMRRQAASSIVIPQAGGGAIGPGGLPGGGKIRLP